jgi:hypothetical protein
VRGGCPVFPFPLTGAWEFAGCVDEQRRQAIGLILLLASVVDDGGEKVRSELLLSFE